MVWPTHFAADHWGLPSQSSRVARQQLLPFAVADLDHRRSGPSAVVA